MPARMKGNRGTSVSIASSVISLTLSSSGTKLDTPLEIVFQHFTEFVGNRKCSFWNYSSNNWDTNGCTMTSSNSSVSVCHCNHLTNFAILMSPWTNNNVVSSAIRIISITGAGISTLCLVLTVSMHAVLWRYVKSDRVVVLINLSVALVLSYVIFVTGVDRTENKNMCTAVAVTLQYIYLVVFFLMLCEGIEIYIKVVYVFGTKSRLQWLLPSAWGIPAIIVGVSVGVTKLEGYGTKEFCWLSLDDGLIWSFIGPALFIMLVNFICLLMVLKVMFSTRAMLQKSGTEKIRAGIRCLCILLPLIGCTWIIGIFYVETSVNWIQYAFAVCNSLQGVTIFIFHCSMNKQIRTAIIRHKQKYSRYSSGTQTTASKSGTEKTKRAACGEMVVLTAYTKV